MIEDIPKWYRVRAKDNPGTNAHIWCNKCKKTITSNRCSHSAYHVYQTRPWNRFLGRVTNVKSWPGVKTFKEFKRLHETYKQELEKTNFNVTTSVKKKSKPIGIRECAAMYVDFIKGIDVDDHRKRIRGDRTVKSFVRYYNRFITSLKEKGIETPTLSIYDIEDKQVGIYSAYVKALPQVKTNSSYNDHFKKMGAFYSYLKNELRHDIVNPFDRVVRMKEVKKNIHITQNEFDIFLSMIKPENGRHLTMKEANSNTFVIVYKPWQAQAFRLAILTGVRSQNLFELKWSDVHETVIQIENIKYNNSGNKEIQKVKEFFYAIRTKELNDLLIELGEEKNIGTDRYLLEPDSKLKRSSLKFYASIGFTHFWRLTGFSKKATLHSLRSTALTNFKIIMRENISALNTHKSDKVREGNYENQTAILSNYAGKEFYGR